MVVEVALGRQVRYDVLMMNHPVEAVGSAGDVLCHRCVSDPWTAKIVHVYLFVELLPEAKTSDR